MSKLKEEELLEEFEYFTKNIPKHITSDEHSPLNKHGRACEQIVALIKKPEVTEEWYEEKVKQINAVMVKLRYVLYAEKMKRLKDFTRSFVKEILGK